MCDYSLQHIASRPARLGEVLVSTEFSNTFTKGFAAPGEPKVAVCLMPGTELAFERDVRREAFLLFSRNLGERVARFRQVHPEMPYSHHDALEFPSGRIVLLTELTPGQKARVLQLPSTGSLAREGTDRAASIDERAAPAGDTRRPATSGARGQGG